MRRTAALAAAALIATLGLSAGCSTAQKAWDCGRLALQITSDVQDVQSALTNAADDPTAADTALRSLTADLDRLGKQSGNADLTQAVQDLHTQISDVQQAVDAKRTPDLAPLVGAATNLSGICTQG